MSAGGVAGASGAASVAAGASATGAGADTGAGAPPSPTKSAFADSISSWILII